MLLNNQMKDYLKDVNPDESKQHIDPIWTSFTSWDDCILLERNLRNVKLPNNFSATYFHDRTSLEADINHVHLNTIFKQDENSIVILRFALTILDIWERKLEKDYPERNFHLILSYDGEEVVLRFYSLREHEPSWVDVENLENYKEEGLLVRIV